MKRFVFILILLLSFSTLFAKTKINKHYRKPDRESRIEIISDIRNYYNTISDNSPEYIYEVLNKTCKRYDIDFDLMLSISIITTGINDNLFNCDRVILESYLMENKFISDNVNDPVVSSELACWLIKGFIKEDHNYTIEDIMYYITLNNGMSNEEQIKSVVSIYNNLKSK